jgi:hypothetical protein
MAIFDLFKKQIPPKQKIRLTAEEKAWVKQIISVPDVLPEDFFNDDKVGKITPKPHKTLTPN